MDQKSGKPSQKRRAILQGSLAAPVVLTVSSASATTMTTLGKCMTNIGTEQPSTFFLDPKDPKDKWFRRRVTVVKLRNSAGDKTDWLYFDPGFNDYVLLTSPLVKTGYAGDTAAGWTTFKESERWALVWLDSTRAQPYSQIQVERPTSSYQVSTTTCACSVNPALRQG
jgi:hypothetical protein